MNKFIEALAERVLVWLVSTQSGDAEAALAVLDGLHAGSRGIVGLREGTQPERFQVVSGFQTCC